MRTSYSRRSYLLPLYYLLLGAFTRRLYSIRSWRDLRYASAEIMFDLLSLVFDVYALASLHVVRDWPFPFRLEAFLTDEYRQNGEVVKS